jgi:ribosomal 50S subunit-recycling heat shock protein
MRLDKYLKVSRLIKRRTVAKDVCDGDKVSVNGRVAKAATTVKEGDIISLTMRGRLTEVKVLKTPETVRAADAETLYEIL